MKQNTYTYSSFIAKISKLNYFIKLIYSLNTTKQNCIQ